MKVVFTNGCFDVLHTGHLKLLREARELGDILVVGLNDDESVRRLKGPSRPVIPCIERKEMLYGFKFVTLVVPFGEDTPIEVVRVLKPDIIVKGSEWRGKYVAGQEYAPVAYVDALPEHSTSKILGQK